MSEEQTVTYELEGEIALVGLNRPDKRNCFNPTVMKQLREAIERAGEEAKCGIIFGHGDNFCAGLDLRWAAESWKTGRSERLPFPFNRNTYFEAMAKAKELAAKICKNAPLSNFAITNSLPRIQDMSYDDGLFFERMVAEYTRSPESIQRLHQFLDKTAPRVRPE
jgi:enoyl-CoA hydratase/carnithine racemase